MALPQGGREVGEGIQIVVAILHTFTFGVGNTLKYIGIKLQRWFFIFFAGGGEIFVVHFLLTRVVFYWRTII